MGQSIPKPITSVPLTREGGEHFKVGMAEMNGWRPAMEDSHVIHMVDNWGFFGVFDGHGGSACSNFITRRMKEELDSKGLPGNDDTVREMVFALDQEFLDSGQSSGTTGTFVIVELPKVEGEKHSLRIGNVGDSRILLGKADGTMVEGPGSDGAWTTDHKPDHPMEEERIKRTGGHVQNVKGVMRVNGDLAVSRAFGDGNYKETGGPGPGDHPVTSEPEFFLTECDPSDFLLLVCDGISEGSFPNREVVQLAAEGLREHGDPGAAAAAVCRRALVRKSMDNLTCMIVLLNGGTLEPKQDLLPGQFWDCLSMKRFKDPYASMAVRGGCSLAKAVEKRFDLVVRQLRALEAPVEEQENLGVYSCWVWEGDGQDEVQVETKIAALKDELTMFGGGPSDDLLPGSEERTEWFESFVQNAAPSACEGSSAAQLNMNALTPDLNNQCDQELRKVRVADIDITRPAVEGHSALIWNDKLIPVCGIHGMVVQDDAKDGTSLVRFSTPLGIDAWLPTSILADANEEPTRVKVACLEEVKRATEAHEMLEWHEKLESIGGTEGTVVDKDNGDGTTCVMFGEPHSMRAWLPTVALTYLEAEPPAPSAYPESSQADYMSGTCMVPPSEVANDVGSDDSTSSGPSDASTGSSTV